MAEKIYFDAFKTAKKSGYGIRFGGKAEEIIEAIRKHTNSKGYINFQMLERREEGQYGDTHYVVVDTWVPTPREEAPKEEATKETDYQNASAPNADDDLPF